MKRNARLRCPFRKGTCEITQKTRRQCQACRLRKCLESGMRKESEWQGVPRRAGARRTGTSIGGGAVGVGLGMCMRRCAHGHHEGVPAHRSLGSSWPVSRGQAHGAELAAHLPAPQSLWRAGQMEGTSALCSV